MKRPTCTVCGRRPATSYSTQKCEVCMYAEIAGAEKAAAQAAAAASDKENRKRPKTKARP